MVGKNPERKAKGEGEGGSRGIRDMEDGWRGIMSGHNGNERRG